MLSVQVDRGWQDACSPFALPSTTSILLILHSGSSMPSRLTTACSRQRRKPTRVKVNLPDHQSCISHCENFQKSREHYGVGQKSIPSSGASVTLSDRGSRGLQVRLTRVVPSGDQFLRYHRHFM